MDECIQRAARLCDLMNQQMRSRSAEQRDRMLQRFIAEAKTPSERFHTLGVLMNFVIARNRSRREPSHG